MIDLLSLTEIIALSTTLNVTVTILLFKLIVMKLGLSKYMRLASAGASALGHKSGEVRHMRKVAAMNEGTKKRITDAAIQELPMGAVLQRVIERAGISPTEIFNLLQDQDFMKGVMVMINTFGGVVSRITGKGEKTLSNTQPAGNETMY